MPPPPRHGLRVTRRDYKLDAMRIFISGDGESGTHLAKLLSAENQDVIIMGNDEARLGNLDARYNMITAEGNPLSVTDLRRAGADSADLFVAVNRRAPVNITACQLAKMLGALSTVARVDAGEFLKPPTSDFFNSSGVDTLLFPELLAAYEVRMALKVNWAKSWFELHEGQLTVLGVKLDACSPLAGIQLKDLVQAKRIFHVAAIKRGRQTIIPRGSDYLLAGDIVYLVTTPEGLPGMPARCGRTQAKVKRVMIAGGDKFTRVLVRELSHDYSITVVEPDRTLCRRIAELGCDVNIVNADYRNIEVLRDENLDSMDAFLAFSGSTETNIVSSMVAREFGVRIIMADIEDIQYIAEAESLNIDKVINKKLITSSHILRHVLGRDVSTTQVLSLEDAEVAEIVVAEGARVTLKQVKDLKLSRSMTIAGLIRGGSGVLVDGNTLIRPGDHVVVVCLNGHLHAIERLFG